MTINAIGLVASAAQLALLQRAFIRPQRSMGGIVAHVVLSEQHSDTLQVTEHPVERGAAVADHAIKQPAEVTIKCGWSNSPPSTGLTLTGASVPITVTEVYQTLLRQQSELALVQVQTGKRLYTNMLLVNLQATTEPGSENVLLITATYRQLLLAGTQTLSLAPGTSTKQADPRATGAVSEGGAKQLKLAPMYGNPQAGP